MSMATAMQHEEEEVSLNEPVQMESVADQQTSDLLPKARRVPLRIVKAQVRTNFDDKEDKSAGWVKRLSIQYAVGEDGTDGDGSHKNRRHFEDYIIAFTHGDGVREGAWWKDTARGPVKELFTALGIALNPPPPIDQEFLDELADREIYADIIQTEIREKTDQLNEKTGKPLYKGTGEYKNELRGHRKMGEHEA